MKTTHSKLKYYLIASMAILALSCSVEEGEDGVDGMDGAPGIQGEQGPPGQDGEDGADGNANVNSYTFDISSVSGVTYGQNIPELTQSVIDDDVVLGYVKRNINWHQLPAIGHFLPFSISADMTPGFYIIDFVDLTDGSDFAITAGELDLLKVVVIESNSNTTSKNTHPDFSKMTYFEVMDYLGLDY
ncbi:collagen-like triple helix repeat-containing protein [Costertonia aggregata]|uniref:Collagen-like protein n=1 Tax=Costertonia aggregata TaxID=343403 RepID=A0A7H9ASQ4_9FLAO|nr:collagen-like protein [Costertonia aggregata]QLG46225.1 collagen-like protein [Costertonia aggregata]